jgi:hypothetical protein
MRKLLALALVVLLSMTMVLAVVGCGQQTQESTMEASPEPMMGDTLISDTLISDTLPR